MRRFLTTSFIALSLAIGAMSGAPLAHADNLGGLPQNGQACDLVKGSGAADGLMQNGTCVSLTSYATQSGPQPTDPNVGSDTDSIFNTIMIKIVSLFAWLLGVAVLILDYTVYYTVINMGSYLSHLTAIGVTWRILRDIGNILLIFGFLAIGITTILDVGWYGGGKKMLPMLLLAAVFLNFSLFFSEAVIDVGNLFATQFYTQINGGVTPTAFSTSALTLANVSSEPISSKLMSQLGLQTIYGNGVANSEVFKQANPWYVGFMGIILFMVTSFVMFALAFILIARFVKLVYLIIIAPIGFAGLAVPQLAGEAKKWWGSLFEQTITAPVLLLLLYVALAVITDAQFLTGTGTATGFVNNANLPGFASYLLSFTIAISLLVAVALSATRLGAFGGSWVTKTAGKAAGNFVTRNVGAATFGVAAWGLNRTVGRGAYYAQRGLRQNKTFNKVNALTGRVMTRGLDVAATGNYDVRSTTIGAGLKGLGVDVGAAQKGGFTEAREKSIKDHEGEAKRIETAFKEGFNDKDKAKMTAKEEEEKTNAENARKEAEEAEAKAKKDRDAAEELRKQHESEVARLTTFGIGGEALTTAQQNLATSDAGLKEATENLTKATANLDAAKTEEGKAKAAKEKAEGGAMKTAINESKEAYAAGITNKIAAVLPPNLIGYGPAAGAAAKKIRASTKEPGKEATVLAMLKEMAAPKPEGGEKAEGGEKKETTKPAEAAHH